MLRTYQDAGQVFVTVRDPSIEDYLRDHVAGHPGHARALLESAQAFEQVQWLVRRADADRLLGDPDTLAAAVKRTFAATSVTWRSVYWADDPQPDSMREDLNLPRRLRTVHGFMQRSPGLEPLLRPWWRSSWHGSCATWTTRKRTSAPTCSAWWEPYAAGSHRSTARRSCWRAI